MTETQIDVEQLVIDDALVRRLLTSQFPQWADLPVRPVAVRGWDNRTFHLGEHMIAAATEVWEAALETSWHGSPVWIHGDVSPGNLLVQEGRLSSVIDFGMLGVGDPACDLSIAWTLLGGEIRDVFRTMLPLDTGTWARGRGWTLWKTLIVAAGLTDTNAVEAAQPWRTIDEVLVDHRHSR